MKRRNFITLLGGAAVAWPLAAHAQQPGEQIRRISILSVFSDSDQEARSLVAAFRQKLTELGWSEGRNIHTDYCWTSGDANRMRACATELATTPPDAVLEPRGLLPQKAKLPTRRHFTAHENNWNRPRSGLGRVRRGAAGEDHGCRRPRQCLLASHDEDTSAARPILPIR